MIPTYNCVHHLHSALNSVLQQDPGPDQMQIEVIDDASTAGDPGALVSSMGGRVGFWRQPNNVGHVRNFETCLARSRGRLVHLLHDDDAVRPGFYATMERALRAHPEIGAAFCRHVYIDEQGHPISLGRIVQEEPGVIESWLPRIAVRQRLQTCAIVVRREVYERLGGFDRRIQTYGEDWEMWARIAAHYPVWYEPEPLAEYRLHPVSLAKRSYRTGQNVRDLRQAIEIIRSYLPPELQDSLTKQARKEAALVAVRQASKSARLGDWATARIQIKEGCKTSLAPVVLTRIAWTGLRDIARWGARPLRRTTRRSVVARTSVGEDHAA
ncbi:MAG: glycosyltransferase [Gemmatimonadota bacterium]